MGSSFGGAAAAGALLVDAAGLRNGKQVKGGTMTEYRKVTREELDELANGELPERAAMSLINANVAVPVNAAVAANVLSDQSVAGAGADQHTPIDQTNLG
jgi:hypothetical protein